MDGIGGRLSRRSAIVQCARSCECESSREGAGWRPSRRSAIVRGADLVGSESTRDGLGVRALKRSAAATAPESSPDYPFNGKQHRRYRQPRTRPRRDGHLTPPSMESSLRRTDGLGRDRDATLTPLPFGREQLPRHPQRRPPQRPNSPLPTPSMDAASARSTWSPATAPGRRRKGEGRRLRKREKPIEGAGVSKGYRRRAKRSASLPGSG